MKTTIELPDNLMKVAKSLAAKRSMSFKDLAIEALKRVIAEVPMVNDEPHWRRCFGAFRDSKEETASIQAIIDCDMSQINPDEWT